MSRKLAMSAVFIATTVGLLASTVPAMAQNRDADIRFEAAQRRFDGELVIFRAEVERYERARAMEPAIEPKSSPAIPRSEEPRRLSDDAVRHLDEPAGAPAPQRDPGDRDEAGNQPPR